MIRLDARLIGYECHNSINYSLFFSTLGDCLDRYPLRFNEIIESCKIIYIILYIIINSFIINSNSISYSIMELLISDFFINYPLIIVLIQSCKVGIESSKGIYSLFASSFPLLTINIVCNDFLTLNSINYICKEINLGDLIAILGSIDFVLGSVDLLCYLCFCFPYYSYFIVIALINDPVIDELLTK